MGDKKYGMEFPCAWCKDQPPVTIPSFNEPGICPNCGAEGWLVPDYEDAQEITADFIETHGPEVEVNYQRDVDQFTTDPIEQVIEEAAGGSLIPQEFAAGLFWIRTARPVQP